jgi:chemosensory pili system protein ChpA (sensor histidine kinase/response regulator)
VVGGACQLLRDGVLQESAVVKRLFGQLDRNIKRLMDYGESVFSDLLTDDLLKNLLFQISQTRAESPRIQLIRNTYGLQEPAETAAADAASELSDELLQSVALTARDDVERIKDQLDSCLRSSIPDPAVFGQVADEMHTLGKMLGMIGMDQLGDAVASQEQFLRRRRKLTVPSKAWILPMWQTPGCGGRRAGRNIRTAGQSAASDQGEVVFRQGQEAVIAAIMTDISAAKISINEFLKSNSEFSLLDNVPVLLHKICGGLVLAGEERLAAASDQVKRFITRVLLAEHRALDENELDDLAARSAASVLH